MHLNGLEDSEKDGVLKKFFGVVCPVAKGLEAKGRRLAVHWADSGEIRRETPAGQKRMTMPVDACKDAANIDYWVGAPVGSASRAGVRMMTPVLSGMSSVIHQPCLPPTNLPLCFGSRADPAPPRPATPAGASGLAGLRH